MILLQLIVEFFKVGLFAVGGGLATIPFLAELSENYHWFSMQMLSDMIAVSESTPGAIGINMSTFVGYTTAGIPGGILATLGLIAPSIIIICIIAKMLKKFKDSPYVKAIFYGLRPAVTAMIAAAGLDIFMVTIFNVSLFEKTKELLDLFQWRSILLFVIIFGLSNKFKKLHPIVFIAGAAVIGIVFHF